jgi:hypothetical protein
MVIWNDQILNLEISANVSLNAILNDVFEFFINTIWQFCKDMFWQELVIETLY